MHSKNRVKFPGWIIKIISVLQTNNAAFKVDLECATIFDTMPYSWKSWTTDTRQEVVYEINQLVSRCFPDE